MMRHIALLLMLVSGLAGCQSQAVRVVKAVSAIRELGGEVYRNETLPGRTVIMVNLHDTKVTDADLKNLRELKDLQWLWLGHTQVTDAGLKDLKKLEGLQTLDLTGTQITDAGLNEIKQALPKTDISGP